jgi:50S ribosomal protein L16 3-hydroxylase
MTLNNFDIDDFLRNYWQKKPLLIRNAIANFENPISADELAGLACEQHIESRLITSKAGEWSLQNGPFEDSLFNTLPDKDWTLLVQAVDQWVDEVADLLNYFRFIPNWRIDDVMISYATVGGGVGPHYDNYDVFLLQGAGKRRWQLGPRCNEDSKLQDNSSLRLLADFAPEEDYVLEAGDILYVPPLYGHYGIATDNECMTYSIGFRAPSSTELLADFCDEQLSKLTDFERYTDPSLPLQSNPGEIQPAVIDKIQQQLIDHFSDSSQITEWFGRYMTQAKYSDNEVEAIEPYSHDDVIELITQEQSLFRDSASRFAFSRLPEHHLLYVNGQSFVCVNDASKQLAELLSGHDKFPANRLSSLINDADSFNLLLTLINQGSVYFDEQDYI